MTHCFLRKSPHRLGEARALGVAFALLLAACSTAENEAAFGASDICFYGCADDGPAARDASATEPSDDAPDGAVDVEPLHPLCGQGSCLPDSPTACTDPLGLEIGEGPGTDDGDVRSDDDEDAGAPGDADADASMPPDAGDEVHEDAGTDAGKPPPLLPHVACHVTASANGTFRSCEPTGTGEANAPCLSSADCAPGLGCVGPALGGVCQPYCCGDPEACPSRTYCDARPLRDGSHGESQSDIPVCVPAMGCKLLEQQPCADLGLVCSVVRADGTTSCVPQGAGKLDEPCPCAFGYICAKSTNKCLKLCHVSQSSTECPGGTCQGGTGGLPEGFGVCVGGYQDAG